MTTAVTHPPLPPIPPMPAQLDAALREVTRSLVEGALVAAGGNRGQAAAALGVPRRRLERLVADVVGRERVAALGQQHGWPGVAERAAWAREGRRKAGNGAP